MSIDPTLPLQLAQLGLTERLAHDAQTQPELARSATQQAAQEALRHERKHIQKSEDAEHSSGVDAQQEDASGRGQDRQFKKRRPQPPEAPTEGDDDNNPWTGNILNIKV